MPRHSLLPGFVEELAKAVGPRASLVSFSRPVANVFVTNVFVASALGVSKD